MMYVIGCRTAPSMFGLKLITNYFSDRPSIFTASEFVSFRHSVFSASISNKIGSLFLLAMVIVLATRVSIKILPNGSSLYLRTMLDSC
jgi:hypothetical protein